MTGATGFLGNELLKQINHDHFKVTVCGRNTNKLENLSKTYKRIKVINGDLSNAEDFHKIFKKNFDHVYHLAGYKYVNLSETKVSESINANLITTLNLFQSCILNNIKAGISLVSSDKTANVKGVYSATKFLNDRLVSEYIDKGLEINILKLSNIFTSPGSVGEIWKENILKNQPIKVSNPKSTRFFSTKEDVINSLLNKNIKLKVKSLEMDVLIKSLIFKYNKSYNLNNIQLIGLKTYENLHEFSKNIKCSSEDYQKYSMQELFNYV